MSESRNNGESRCCGYSSSYVTPSSESRNSGESRYNPITDNYISDANARNENSSKYNNLTDIDSLIERLEKEKPRILINSPRINQALNERNAKINQLKALREQIKKESEEEKILKTLEASNSELDEAIANVKKLVKTPVVVSDDHCSYGESHTSGESHW